MVQTTYLDPVSNYGGLFSSFGIEKFGDCADFSEAYIDTEDSVPGSNQRLLSAYTIDVTEVRKKLQLNESPHLWPVRYYTSLVRRDDHPLFRNDTALAEKFPPGEMVKR